MPEIAWDINRIEAQAKKWQEMASALPNDHDRVAWLIEQISYLSASHMQLQEVFRLTTDGLVRVMNKADGVEKVQLIQMEAIARSLQGQLTSTIHMDDADMDEAKALMPVLERKAGRILTNGFPTGVEVCDAMVHGRSSVLAKIDFEMVPSDLNLEYSSMQIIQRVRH